jgi:hypothetical protein
MVREHWLAQIDEHSLSQHFLAGAVNFATLMPMRAIPFKRVCLLGIGMATAITSPHPLIKKEEQGKRWRKPGRPAGDALSLPALKVPGIPRKIR